MLEIATPVDPYPPPTDSESKEARALVATKVVAFGKLIEVPLIFPVAVVAPNV